MSKQDIYREYFFQEGYRPTVDENGDIIFKCQGRTYMIDTAEEDDELFRLIAPNIWSIDSDEERALVERVSSKVTGQVKVTKVYPFHDNTWASVEIFFAQPDDFKNIFNRCMSALDYAVQQFRQSMKQEQEQIVEEEPKLLN